MRVEIAVRNKKQGKQRLETYQKKIIERMKKGGHKKCLK